MSLLLLAAASAIGAARTLAQQPAGSPTSGKPALSITPAEIELYKRARTLMDWTPQQIGSIPLLHKLRLAESQDELPSILERTGRNTAAVFSDFPKISCDEEVYFQTNLKNPLAPGGGMHSSDAIYHFHYIIIPKPVGDIPMFDEYRTDAKGRPVETTSMAGLRMVASRFTGDSMYFIPSEQPYSRFRYFGTQSVQKRECYVVGFAQKPESARLITAFRMVDPPAVLLVQGLAWADEQSFQILKIHTWLLAPRTDIGLNGANTVVNYFPVRPAGLDRVLWVPHDLTVAVLFRGGVFQNTHHYSKFKLFRVESTIKPVE